MRRKVSDRTPVVQGFASGKTLVRRTPGGFQSAAGSAGCLKSDYFLPRNSMILSRNIAAYLPHSKAAGVPLVFTGPAGSESRPVQGFAFGKTLARRTPGGSQSAAGSAGCLRNGYFLPLSSMILSRSTAAYSNSSILLASFISFSRRAISASRSLAESLVPFLPPLSWAA